MLQGVWLHPDYGRPNFGQRAFPESSDAAGLRLVLNNRLPIEVNA
jgi:hypothetical protein